MWTGIRTKIVEMTRAVKFTVKIRRLDLPI